MHRKIRRRGSIATRKFYTNPQSLPYNEERKRKKKRKKWYGNEKNSLRVTCTKMKYDSNRRWTRDKFLCQGNSFRRQCSNIVAWIGDLKFHKRNSWLCLSNTVIIKSRKHHGTEHPSANAGFIVAGCLGYWTTTAIYPIEYPTSLLQWTTEGRGQRLASEERVEGDGWSAIKSRACRISLDNGINWIAIGRAVVSRYSITEAAIVFRGL